MKPLTLLFFALAFPLLCLSKTKVITVSATDGARIFVNGRESGNPTTIVIRNNGEVAYLRVEKPGYITANRQYSFVKSKRELPDNEYIQLDVDDAYQNSDVTDQANKDIDLKTSINEDEAWKLISRIATSYFDVIEVTDKTTGYLRTAWTVRKFNGGTVRTRLIVKTGTSSPLSYKVKLSSEIAGGDEPGNTNDDTYRPWDRVLRSYEGLISELQNRMSKQ